MLRPSRFSEGLLFAVALLFGDVATYRHKSVAMHLVKGHVKVLNRSAQVAKRIASSSMAKQNSTAMQSENANVHQSIGNYIQMGKATSLVMLSSGFACTCGILCIIAGVSIGICCGASDDPSESRSKASPRRGSGSGYKVGDGSRSLIQRGKAARGEADGKYKFGDFSRGLWAKMKGKGAAEASDCSDGSSRRRDSDGSSGRRDSDMEPRQEALRPKSGAAVSDGSDKSSGKSDRDKKSERKLARSKSSSAVSDGSDRSSGKSDRDKKSERKFGRANSMPTELT